MCKLVTVLTEIIYVIYGRSKLNRNIFKHHDNKTSREPTTNITLTEEIQYGKYCLWYFPPTAKHQNTEIQLVHL